MITSDIKYTITANVNLNKLVFADITDYTVLAATVVTGLLKVTDPLGTVIYENAGYSADDFSSPDIDVSGSTLSKDIVMTLDANGDIVKGDYIVEYKLKATVGGSAIIYLTGETVNYCFKHNDTEITITHDCKTAILISKDVTNYVAICSGSPITDYTLTRTHEVDAPLGSGYGTIATSSDAVRTFTDTWTKTWQTTISTIAVYEISDNYFIQYTYTGYDTLDVECNDCMCDMNTCIRNLYDKYIAALGTNLVLANSLEKSLLQVTSLFAQYSQLVECGEDTTTVCSEMKSILTSTGCVCNTYTDDASIPVTKLYDAFAGSKTFIDTGVPSDTLGADTDIYFDTDNWDVYQKVSESWASKGNIKGDTGAAGNSTAILPIEASFESKETGVAEFVMPFACSLGNIVGYVSHNIEATDDGKIEISKNTDAVLQNNVISITAGTLFGTSIAPITMASLDFNGTTDTLKITTSKTTDGGKVQLFIKYTLA